MLKQVLSTMKTRARIILAIILFVFVVVWVVMRGSDDDRKIITDIFETQWAVEHQAYKNLDSTLLATIYTNAPELCPLSENNIKFVKQIRGIEELPPEQAGLLSLREALMYEYGLAREVEPQNNLQVGVTPQATTPTETPDLPDNAQPNNVFYLAPPYPMPETTPENALVSYPMPETVWPPFASPLTFAIRVATQFPPSPVVLEEVRPLWLKPSIQFIGVFGAKAVAYVRSSVGTRLITLVRRAEGWRIGCEQWLTYNTGYNN